MAKTDWGLNDIVRPQDMNDIGGEINQLRIDVDNIEVPPASLTQAGIVQLNDAVNSTSTSQAATANAVKKAYDRADQAFQLGNERKQEIVDVLIAKGISASTSESWETLIAKMAGIIKATGNAAVGDVLSGRTFSNETGNNRIGTMANQGAQVITPGIANKAIPAGYHNGSGYVAGDPDLVAANFPKDVNLFGIQGILERMTTAEKQAVANAITGKGVPTSVNDTNAVLAQKIGQITTGQVIPLNHSVSGQAVTNGNYTVRTLFDVPNGTKRLAFFSELHPNNNSKSRLTQSGNNFSHSLSLFDGNYGRIIAPFNSFESNVTRYPFYFIIDFENRKFVKIEVVGSSSYVVGNSDFPSGFISTNVKLIHAVINGNNATGTITMDITGDLLVV